MTAIPTPTVQLDSRETPRSITLGELIVVLHDLTDDPEQIQAVIRHLSRRTLSRRSAKRAREPGPELPPHGNGRIYKRGRDSSRSHGA